jgi:hypothetical protein
MKHQVLSFKSPIYGRRTGQLEILPMDIWDARDMLKGFSDEDVLMIYGMVGGIPLYLKMFDPGRTVEENIRRLFFEDSSFFRNEHEFVLMEEFDNPFTYYTVLEALASGHVKVSDVATYCSLDDSTVHKYLTALTNTSFVERVAPVDNPDGKMARYRISDNFMRFQFRRVLPVVEYYDLDDPSHVLEGILKGLETDMGVVFEQVCGQHLRSIHKGKLGKWWGADPINHTQEEIDLVSTRIQDGRRIGWFAECKYRSELTGVDVLERLKHRSALVKGYDGSAFVLYSKAGFTPRLSDSAEAELFSLKDVLAFR